MFSYIRHKIDDHQAKKDIEKFDKLMQYAMDMATYKISSDTEMPR